MQICLVLVLVPVNSFCFWSLQNILFLKIVPAGTIFKSKIFCRDYLSNKWVQSSCVTCGNHHKSQAKDQNQNETYLQEPKTTTKKNYKD